MQNPVSARAKNILIFRISYRKDIGGIRFNRRVSIKSKIVIKLNKHNDIILISVMPIVNNNNEIRRAQQNKSIDFTNFVFNEYA